MKKIYVRIICMVLSILFFQEYCKAQADSLVTFESFDYDEYGNTIYSSVNGWVWNSGRMEREKTEVSTFYPSAYPSSSNDFITNMYVGRILNRPLAMTRSGSRDGGPTMYTDRIELFVYDPVFSFLPVAHYQVPFGSQDAVPIPDFNAAILSIDPRFQKLYQVDVLDPQGRPLQVTDRAGIVTSYLYSENGLLIGQVQNAARDEIAYAGFEYGYNDGAYGWVFNNGFILNGSYSSVMGQGQASFDFCEKEGLIPSKSYILSFWSFQDSGEEIDYTIEIPSGTVALVDTLRVFHPTEAYYFKKYTYRIKGTDRIALNKTNLPGKNANLDEIRLHPEDAVMQTTTYRPVAGIYRGIQSCDTYNDLSWTDYDVQGRLVALYDKYLNMIIRKEYYPWNY